MVPLKKKKKKSMICNNMGVFITACMGQTFLLIQHGQPKLLTSGLALKLLMCVMFKSTLEIRSQGYIAPEVMNGDRSDVYLYGIVSIVAIINIISTLTICIMLGGARDLYRNFGLCQTHL